MKPFLICDDQEIVEVAAYGIKHFNRNDLKADLIKITNYLGYFDPWSDKVSEIRKNLFQATASIKNDGLLQQTLASPFVHNPKLELIVIGLVTCNTNHSNLHFPTLLNQD